MNDPLLIHALILAAIVTVGVGLVTHLLMTWVCGGKPSISERSRTNLDGVWK